MPLGFGFFALELPESVSNTGVKQKVEMPSQKNLIANRWLRLLLLLVMSWCVMTLFHELGHIVCGTCCGGVLQTYDLWPWHLPLSIFDPDPIPLVTLWGGPVLGTVVPMLFAMLVRKDWSWFIAYFCILANGLYLATAWYSGDKYLDTPKLLEHGAHPITIALYCAVTIGFGYIGFRHQCLRALAPNRETDILRDDQQEGPLS